MFNDSALAFFFTYITNYEKYNLCISFADGNGRTVLHLRIKPWSGILNTVLNPPPVIHGRCCKPDGILDLYSAPINEILVFNVRDRFQSHWKEWWKWSEESAKSSIYSSDFTKIIYLVLAFMNPYKNVCESNEKNASNLSLLNADFIMCFR